MGLMKRLLDGRYGDGSIGATAANDLAVTSTFQPGSAGGGGGASAGAPRRPV